MAEFALPKNSRIQKGEAHPSPQPGGTMRSFRIYRYDPHSGENPRFDTFEVNLDELASARWLSREELRPENLPKDGSFFMPRRDSIARRLIEEWLGHEAGPSING